MDIGVQARLLAAIDVLATSPRRIQERVMLANLSLAPLSPRDFADLDDEGQAAALLTKLEAQMTKALEGRDTGGPVTPAAMSDDEASEWASGVMTLLKTVL
jgi:hypothetical protein